jgi:hypothetical protein
LKFLIEPHPTNALRWNASAATGRDFVAYSGLYRRMRLIEPCFFLKPSSRLRMGQPIASGFFFEIEKLGEWGGRC